MTQITKTKKKDDKHTISSAIHKALSSHIFIKEKKFLKAIEKAAGNIVKKIAKIAKEKAAPKPATKSSSKKPSTAVKSAKAKVKPLIAKAAPKKVASAVKEKAKPTVKKAAPRKKPDTSETK